MKFRMRAGQHVPSSISAIRARQYGIRSGWQLVVVTCVLGLAPGVIHAQLPYDYDNDGEYTCHDAEVLQGAIRENTVDPQFDIDNDGEILFHDLDRWLERVSVENGFRRPLLSGDINLDDSYSNREAAITMSKSAFRLDYEVPVSGWCEGDFDGDLIVGRIDSAHGLFTDEAFTLPPREEIELVAEPFPMGQVFGRTAQYELIAYPQPSPSGLAVTQVSVRMRDANHDVVVIDQMRGDGPLHQAALIYQGDRPFVDFDGKPLGSATSKLVPEELLSYDTHQLVFYHIGGAKPTELNDESDPFELQTLLPEQGFDDEFISGIGSTYIRGPISPYRGDDGGRDWREVKLMQLVRPLDATEEVTFSVRIQAVDENLDLLPYLQQVQDVPVPFGVESDCDYDENRICDIGDLDLLVRSLGTEDADLDLTSVDALLTVADVDRWLELASADRSVTYVVGDANLDGQVNAVDLNRVAQNWGQTGTYGWSEGDLNGDGIVNAIDLNAVATHWQFSGLDGADSPQLAMETVPEPAHGMLFALGMLLVLNRASGITKRDARRR